jgi:hypothetical protein
VVVALTGLFAIIPGLLEGTIQVKDKLIGLFQQEAEVPIEVASADHGETPGRILIYDGTPYRRYDVPGTHGSRVIEAKLDLYMPRNGEYEYYGILTPERNRDFPNRIQLVGEMLPQTPLHKERLSSNTNLRFDSTWPGVCRRATNLKPRLLE